MKIKLSKNQWKYVGLQVGWLKIASEGVQSEGVQSVIRENQYGRKFFTLYGNTFPIKDIIGRNGLGFSFFKGTWGMPVDMITPDIRSKLQDIGIDCSSLDSVSSEPSTQQVPQEKTTVEQPQIELSPVDKELARMKDGIAMAMKKQGSEKVHGLLGFIDRMIERVAQMTDEAAQSDFVKSFLNFAAKFHNYSFGNQMLIWVQKPDSTYVKGFKQWMEMGREVTNWDNGIAIIAPMFKKMEYTPEQLTGKSQAQIDSMPKMRTFFQAVKVYDVSDTKPIDGWQKLKGKQPFEPPKLRTDLNEDVEEISAMINATTDWAKEKGIDVNVESMSESTGGYSAGGKIRINDASKGINYFATLIHECAHEMLHWIEENGKKAKLDATESRQKKEIDAETTSFIVLKHYGFEHKKAPNYLALWKAKGEDIKDRRESIRKAVELIIDGIDGAVKKSQLTEASSRNMNLLKIGFVTNYISNINSI